MRPPIEEPAVHSIFLEEEERVIRPNKSQLKRDAIALLKLGKKLVQLDDSTLQRLNMKDELRQAIREGKAIRQNGAKKRHFKFIGKLLREMDTELLEQTIENMDLGTAKANAAFHRLERWRDRLLDSEDQHALTEWMQEYPQCDAGHLRQLIRNARKEFAQSKPLRSSRLLFQALRESSEIETSKQNTNQDDAELSQ